MAADSEYFAIQTEGLTKIFRDFWGQERVVAVDKLDLETHSHEVFGLLGPNGSGKSTTIKMLLGLLFPTRGWARVLGHTPGDVKTNARIGYLPEESHLYPFLNARETLDFYGRLFKLPRAERRRRIDSLLDMVGLGGVARRPIGQYSKGMARRIGLAQALINDPQLLILDEPTAGLDPIGTRQIKDLIRHLAERGKTVLLCSHLLADVEDVCDRIGILYGGKMQALGRVDELLTKADMTQIRSSGLDDETIAKIKQTIRSSHSDGEIEVSNPRTQLEDFFLDIVAEAQASEQATSGAVVGTGLSEFLTDQRETGIETTTIVEQLVAGREHDGEAWPEYRPGEEDKTSKPVAVEDSEPIHPEAIDSLLDVNASSVAQKSPDPAQELTTPVAPLDGDDQAQEEVDKSLIDDLIKPDRTNPLGADEDKETA